jgi:hypothetical protein
VNRTGIAVALIILLGAAVFAQSLPSTDPVVPQSPEVMAQGGSFTAVARGYNSLFTNPAGFARKGGSLTLASANAWVYARPDYRTLEQIADALSAESEEEQTELGLQIAKEQTEGYWDEDGNFHPGGGVGFGSSSGVAFVGGGIGLGVTLTADAYLSGKRFPLGLNGYLDSNLGFTGGLALPFNLFGMKLYAGADVRYFLQTHTTIDSRAAAKLLEAGASDPLEALNSVPTLNGYGLAFDLGLIAESGPLTVGMSVRDLFGTRVQFAEHGFGEIMTSISEEFDLPERNPEDTEKYVIPASVNLGVGYHPRLGILAWLIDPMIHAEIKDIGGLISEKDSFVKHLHIGSEVRLLSFMKLRAGLNQGYLTMGAGMKILFLDVNAALFTREMGTLPGSRPSSAFAVEAAIRF